MHDAQQVTLQLWVGGHGGVGAAEGEHGRRVHGRVDGDLVPADELQFGVAVGAGVFDSALDERRDEGRVAVYGGGVAGAGRRRVEVREVGPAVYPRPSVVFDLPVGRLCAGRDRDGAADGGAGEALRVGCFNAEPVLDEDDGGVGGYEAFEDRGVVADVREGFGGDDDVVPFCGVVACFVWVGEGVGGGEGVVAVLRGGDLEAVCFDSFIV